METGSRLHRKELRNFAQIGVIGKLAGNDRVVLPAVSSSLPLNQSPISTGSALANVFGSGWIAEPERRIPFSRGLLRRAAKSAAFP